MQALHTGDGETSAKCKDADQLHVGCCVLLRKCKQRLQMKDIETKVSTGAKSE
jgi:hypothetical protein